MSGSKKVLLFLISRQEEVLEKLIGWRDSATPPGWRPIFTDLQDLTPKWGWGWKAGVWR